VILTQLNILKLKLEYLKTDVKCKKRKIKAPTKNLQNSSSTFFDFSSKVCFQNTVV